MENKIVLKKKKPWEAGDIPANRFPCLIDAFVKAREINLMLNK